MDCSKPCKLTYFNGRGRAELSRWILCQGKGCHGFEDCRITFDDWPAMKPKTLMGYLPELKVGDCRLAETGAVIRACAKMCKLDGSCPEECAKADMIAEVCKGLMDDYIRCAFEKNECLKNGLMMKFKEEQFPNFCKKMCSMLKEKGCKFFVGNCLTYADLAVACVLDHLILSCPELAKCMEKERELCSHHSMVCALPNIKEHIAKRPSTPL